MESRDSKEVKKEVKEVKDKKEAGIKETVKNWYMKQKLAMLHPKEIAARVNLLADLSEKFQSKLGIPQIVASFEKKVSKDTLKKIYVEKLVGSDQEYINFIRDQWNRVSQREISREEYEEILKVYREALRSVKYDQQADAALNSTDPYAKFLLYKELDAGDKVGKINATTQEACNDLKKDQQAVFHEVFGEYISKIDERIRQIKPDAESYKKIYSEMMIIFDFFKYNYEKLIKEVPPITATSKATARSITLMFNRILRNFSKEDTSSVTLNKEGEELFLELIPVFVELKELARALEDVTEFKSKFKEKYKQRSKTSIHATTMECALRAYIAFFEAQGRYYNEGISDPAFQPIQDFIKKMYEATINAISDEDKEQELVVKIAELKKSKLSESYNQDFSADNAKFINQALASLITEYEVQLAKERQKAVQRKEQKSEHKTEVKTEAKPKIDEKPKVEEKKAFFENKETKKDNAIDENIIDAIYYLNNPETFNIFIKTQSSRFADFKSSNTRESKIETMDANSIKRDDNKPGWYNITVTLKKKYGSKSETISLTDGMLKHIAGLGKQLRDKPSLRS